MYLARLQRSDPLPQAVRHGFGDHGVEQRVTSLLLLIQLFDDFLQLSVFLLLLKDHKKTGTKESTVTVSPSSYNLFNLCLSCSTEARIKGGTSQGSRAFHPLAHLLRTCSHFHFYALRQIVLIAAYVLVRKQVPAGLTQADLVLTTWRLEASPDQGPAAARLTAVSRPGSALGWSHEGSDR